LDKSQKIQAIYNGKYTANAMQGLVRARGKPLAQEQWEQWKKQCEEQWKQSEIRTTLYVRL